MIQANLNKIEQQLTNTGFILEHNVTQKLQNAGWSVINNRYYIDDVQDAAREIDLIAYKAVDIKSRKGVSLWIYTTLIISCKKSEKNLWAMLFRELNENNPNMDWYPLKNWSNQKVLKYLINRPEWKEEYIRVAKNNGVFGLFEPTGHLFAYQEMDKGKFTCQNQTNIFNAISSLMKAESYEMNSLERRKKNSAIYNFNLISIIDSELVTVHCDESGASASEVEDSRAIFNYIVNKKETASRIHFFTFDAMDKYLSQYDELHKFNKNFVVDQINNFYVGVLNDKEKREILLDDFRMELVPYLNYICFHEHGYKSSFNNDEMDISINNNFVYIRLQRSGQIIPVLNADQNLNNFAANLLLNVYNYNGEFEFMDEIEF